MTEPQTGMEQSGGTEWTTLEQEAAYLAALDSSEQRITVTEIGRSQLDRPIHLARVGEQPNGHPLLVVATQHGSERSPREAVLQYVRDLAQSEDPEVNDYLASHTLWVIPTANPDGFVENTRFLHDGTDMNRDTMRLASPESRFVAAAIGQIRPQIMVDMHDSSSNPLPDDMQSIGGSSDHADQVLKDMSDDLNTAILSHLQVEGYSTGLWPPSDNNAMLTSSGLLRHSLTVVAEGNYLGNRATTAQMNWHYMEGVRRYHAAHSNTLGSEIPLAKQRTAITGSNPPGWVMGGVTRELPTTYWLTPDQAEEYAFHIEAFHVETEERHSMTGISLAQVAYPMLPLTLDHRSPFQRAITGAPGEEPPPDQPPPRGPVKALRVLQGDRAWGVVEMYLIDHAGRKRQVNW